MDSFFDLGHHITSKWSTLMGRACITATSGLTFVTFHQNHLVSRLQTDAPLGSDRLDFTPSDSNYGW